MFNRAYFRAGDVHHHTKVEAAPPGESIRYADEIRKEMESRAERSFRDRMAFEFEAPDLGTIKFTVAESIDHHEGLRLVYFKLNGQIHQMRFDAYKHTTREEMVDALFKEISEAIARRLLIGFAETSKDRLFGSLR